MAPESPLEDQKCVPFGIYEGDIRTGVSGWRSLFSASRFVLLLLMRVYLFFLLLKTIYCVPFWKYNEKKPYSKLAFLLLGTVIKMIKQ